MPGFDDRTVTLDAPEQLADLGSTLASKTRLAVLRALMVADQPLHINEVARRVGVDASPVRTHLELLLKAGLVREVELTVGRERRFTTSVTGIRLTLENVNRPGPSTRRGEAPKVVQRLQRRLVSLAEDAARLEEKVRRTREEMERAWTEQEARAAAKAARAARASRARE